MSSTISYVNGELISSDLAAVSIFDHGFTVADGVFETLKFTNGIPFAIDRHLNRLEKSCNGLGIKFPGYNLLNDAIKQVSQVNSAINFGRMRITATSGLGPLGSDRSNGEFTLIISVAAQTTWPDTSGLLLVPWIRNERSPLVSVKTTSYAENVYALAAAKSAGFDEAIFLNSKGQLTEGSGSNIFLVKNGTIFTPSFQSGLLKGVTRDLVIEWAKPHFEICEESLSKQDLFTAQEVFITSSTRDISPVDRIGQLTESSTIENETEFQVGPITQEIAKIFKANSEVMTNP